MINLIKIIFVFLIYIPVVLQAQAVTWQKWYDYNNYENDGENVIQTFDGGFLILVNNYFPSNVSLLIKINLFGNIQWQRVLDHSVVNASSVRSYAVQQSRDSGYIIAGDSNGDSAFLLKTNKLGDSEWLKKYSRAGLAARFFDLKITMDGEIIACGDLFPPFNKGYIVKTDSLGVVFWDSTYNTNAYKIIETTDSNFYVLSSGLMKINSVGKRLWFTSFPAYMNSMVMDSSEYIYTAGSSDSVYLFKYDSSGTKVWDKRYFPGLLCFTMCISKDQNILIAGALDTLVQTDVGVVKVNKDGIQIFKKRIESVNGNWFKIPYSVKPTSDYGFIFTGLTDYPGFPYHDNVLAIKTDSMCYAPLKVGIDNEYTFVSDEFSLEQNTPNPFNPETTIKYELIKDGLVKIKVFDIMGREITTLINENQSSGKYKIHFNAETYNLSSGIYIYKLETSHKATFKKMVFLK